MLGQSNSILRQKGFTLIEVLIIISIIGVLAAIAVPQFVTYRERAYDSQAKASLHNLYLACKAYWAVKGSAAECTLASASDYSEYGFTHDSAVKVTVAAAKESDFSSEAQHKLSTKLYSIDSEGIISKH